MKKKKITKKINVKSTKKDKKIDRNILKKYKDMLLEKRKSILFDVEKRVKDGKEYNKSEVRDTADQASDSYENELFYGLNDTERKYLEEVENALKRVEDKTYGKCVSCDKYITFERLKILPFARLCIKCQEQDERPNNTIRR